MDQLLGVELESAAAPAASPDARIRTAIAVVVTRFPKIDETFILREINELEKNGQPILVVPIIPGTDSVVHEEAKPWVRRALYTPFFSLAILRSNLRALRKRPLCYLKLVATLITGTIWRPSTLLRTLSVVPKAVHLAEILPALGIRHIHSHFATHATTMTYAIAAMSDITYSFSVHGPDVFVHRLLLGEKLRGAKFVRCVSTFNKAFLSGLYPHLTEGKLEVVHSGLNPDVYAEAALQPERRSSRRAQLLTVATLTRRNGYPFLIDACARLLREGIDLECRIVGDGPLRAATEQWIAQQDLTDRVRIVGNLPQHEVARLMGEADVFVLPSIIAVDGQMEGIPISLMEAMAAGKPVVAAAVSGVPELVKHEVSGILVDATYANRLAEAVRRLIEDPALRERLGRAAQEKVRADFHVQGTALSLMALFDAHLDAHPESTSQRIASLNWSRLGVTSVGVRKIYERGESIIAEVAISDGIARRDVIVRQARTGEDAAKRARGEFEALAVLRQTMVPDNDAEGIVYSVPRLLMFDEPHRAVVTDRADGTALSGLLREARNRSSISRCAVAMRRAGTWLRRMQEQTRGDEDSRHVLTAVVLMALRDLELAAAGDHSLLRSRESIAETIRALESALVHRAVPVVGHHGTFRPENIFIGDRRLEVIDFGSYRDGLPLEDVAQLLLHVELRFGPGQTLDRLRRELLSGFGDPEPDAGSLQLFSIAKALQMLAREGEDCTAFQASRRDRALRRIIARQMNA